MSTHTERLANLLQDWRDDPVRFVREMFGAEPDPWQADFLRAVANNNRVAVRSGHGVGKSTAVAWLVLWFAHTRRPFKIPVTGSNFDQLQKTTWAEIGVWYRKMPPPFQKAWEYTTEMLRLRDAPEECFAALRTASKERAQNLAGFHSENVLVVVDEASAVDDLIYEVLSGALTTRGSKLVLTGNPTLASGRFHRAFADADSTFKQFHVPTFGSRWVEPGWIEEQARDYGEGSNYYRVRVLGEFPTSDADGVIPLDLVTSAVDRVVAPMQSIRPIWGLDVGGEPMSLSAKADAPTNDRSALAKRQGNVLMEPVKWWRGKSTTEVAGLVHREWLDTPEDLRPAEIVVDVIGIGKGVYDTLKVEGVPVRACNVGETHAVEDRFARLRDQLWWKAREWFEALDCSIPRDQELIGELSVPKYGPLPSGKIKVEGKAELAARKVRSPDLADAFIMTFAGNPHSTRYAAAQFRAPADDRPWSGHDPY